jgi:hypothetical protein
MRKSPSSAVCWPPEPLEPTLPEEVEDIGHAKSTTVTQPETRLIEDHKFVSFVIRKLLKIAYFRIQALCISLSIPNAYPIARQAFLAFRYLLRQHIGLLNDRHVDQLLLCTVYGVIKAMKYEPEVEFAQLIEAYVAVRSSELGERTCQRIVRHLKLVVDDALAKISKKPVGNIIDLYNTVYVPAMKYYLLHSKSLKRNTEVIKAMHEAVNRKKTGASEPLAAPGFVNLAADKTVIWEGNVAVEVTLSSAGKSSLLSPDGVKASARPPLCSQGLTTFLYFGGCQSRPVDVTNDLVARTN